MTETAFSAAPGDFADRSPSAAISRSVDEEEVVLLRLARAVPDLHLARHPLELGRCRLVTIGGVPSERSGVSRSSRCRPARSGLQPLHRSLTAPSVLSRTELPRT